MESKTKQLSKISEWKARNPEKVKGYVKKYANQIETCTCGVKVTKVNKYNHRKSQRHKLLMEMHDVKEENKAHLNKISELQLSKLQDIDHDSSCEKTQETCTD